MVPIQMMNLEHQFLSVPITYSTHFTMRFILKNTAN